MSDLHVCAPNFYSTTTAKRHRELLEKSCDKVNIELHPFGIGKQWNGHWEAKLVQFEKYLQLVEEPYVMMIDGDDSLVVQGEEQILDGLNRIPSPVLLAANKKPWPQTVECFEFPMQLGGYSYPNAGGVIGYTIRVWEAVKRVLNNADEVMNKRSDQEGWVREYLKGGVDLDCKCAVFQNMSAGADEDVETNGSRVFNKVTCTYPCVVHFGGRTKGREEMWNELSESGQRSEAV